MEQIERGSLEVRLDWRLHVLVFVIAFAIVVLRRPDAILNPQFWAEDGAVWYANAYNLGGIHSLAIPIVGYFQTISRLVAAFAQILPFSWAPLIFNVVAIIIQVLPVNVMVSSRFSALIPDLRTRIFLPFLYIVLPNSWEVHANLTNAQWHLALLAFMVIVAAPNGRTLWRCFDIGVVLVSGLSGPFSLFLAPIAALRWWLRRDKWLFVLFLLTGICALIQTICLALMHDSRSHISLGATPELFVRILSDQVFLGALIGQRGYTWIVSYSGLHSMLVLIIAVIGLIVIINALLKAPVELRLFIIFAVLIFSTALISPQASDTIPQWQALSIPGKSGRYWFIPMLAFITTLVWMLSDSRSHSSRAFAVLALSIMTIGIIVDWHHPPFTDFKFKKYAQQFEISPQGTQFTIPINPLGWSMTLIKRDLRFSGVQRGTNIDNIPATNEIPVIAVTPSSGSSIPEKAQNFKVVYSDANGADTINEAYFALRADITAFSNAIIAKYNGRANTLSLLNDAGTELLGSCTPGSQNIISNSQGTLNCANTTVISNGNDLIINWNITPTLIFVGTKKMFFYAIDAAQLNSGIVQRNIWKIVGKGQNIERGS